MGTLPEVSVGTVERATVLKSEFRPEDVEDVGTFFGLNSAAVLRRLSQYNPKEMADAWRLEDPKTPGEMREFYGATDLYVWELMQWHASESYLPYLLAIQGVTRAFPPESHPRVLDFGSGTGCVALRMAEAGYRVTICDVPGTTLDFATHRFRRRGLPVHVLSQESDLPHVTGEFDVIVCFDVLEHLRDPDIALFRLTRSLRTGGVAALVANFFTDDVYPHHLEENVKKFGLTGNWRLAKNASGLEPIDDPLYVKVEPWRTQVRKIRYAIWQKTGFFLARIPRELVERSPV